MTRHMSPQIVPAMSAAPPQKPPPGWPALSDLFGLWGDAADRSIHRQAQREVEACGDPRAACKIGEVWYVNPYEFRKSGVLLALLLKERELLREIDKRPMPEAVMHGGDKVQQRYVAILEAAKINARFRALNLGKTKRLREAIARAVEPVLKPVGLRASRLAAYLLDDPEFGFAGVRDNRGRPRGSTPALACYLRTLRLWLDNKCEVASAYRIARHAAECAGEPTGNIRSAQTYIQEWEARNKGAAIMARQGPTAFRTQATPYIKRDAADFRPNELWEIDHTTANFIVRFPDGKSGRPILTAIIDYASGTIMGAKYLRRANGASNGGIVAEAATRYGAPLVLRTDRGKDLLAASFSGGIRTAAAPLEERVLSLLGRLGIELSATMGRHPEAKGKVERTMGIFDREVFTFEPTYLGTNTTNKPEDIHRRIRSGQVTPPTLAEAQARLDKHGEAINHRPIPGGVHRGLSRMQYFEANAISRRTAPTELLKLLAQPHAEVTVGRNGVVFPGVDIRFGGNCPELWRRIGERVVLRAPTDGTWDSVDVLAASAGLEFIVTARAWRMTGASRDQVAEIHKLRKAARKLAREAIGARQIASRSIPDLIAEQQRDAAIAMERKAAGAEGQTPRAIQPIPGLSGMVKTVPRGHSEGLAAKERAEEERAVEDLDLFSLNDDLPADVPIAQGFEDFEESSPERGGATTLDLLSEIEGQI